MLQTQAIHHLRGRTRNVGCQWGPGRGLALSSLMPSASTCTPRVCLIPAEALRAKHHQPSTRSGTLVEYCTPLVPARIKPALGTPPTLSCCEYQHEILQYPSHTLPATYSRTVTHMRTVSKCIVSHSSTANVHNVLRRRKFALVITPCRANSA